MGGLPLRLSCGDVCCCAVRRRGQCARHVAKTDQATSASATRRCPSRTSSPGTRATSSETCAGYGQAEAAELGVEDMARYYARIEEMTDVVRDVAEM